ncbi:MAG: transglutaminase family protein [Limnobacter sp.]|nr:transglutaminase family protein [Limnobacter sp.]
MNYSTHKGAGSGSGYNSGTNQDKPFGMAPAVRRVTHETAYEYEQPAECSQQICILQPQEGPAMAPGLLRKGQRLLNHSLRIQPNPSTLQTHIDVNGNIVTHFEMNYPHDHLSVVSQSELEVIPRLHTGHVDELYSPSWDVLASSLAYHAGAETPVDGQHRFSSKHVVVSEQFRDFGYLDFWPGRSVVSSAYALMSRIHREFKYESGSTTINTTVQEVMANRKGVCQDFAHVMLSVLRSLGLSARYVSGYMLTDPPPGQTKLIGVDASHAWVSVWCGDDIGWVDYDPTNDQLPDLRYVTVAVGRDYADVPPLRGVVHGGGDHALKVAVTVL